MMKDLFKMMYLLVLLTFFLYIEGNISKNFLFTWQEDLGEVIPSHTIQIYVFIPYAADCAILCNDCSAFFYSETKQHCILYAGSDNHLQIQNQTGFRMYAKKISNSDCSSFGFDYMDNICFLILDDKLSWNQGRTMCQDLGADLITLKTIEKYTSIKNKLISLGSLTRGYSVGLNDKEKEGQMKWVDGEDAITHPPFYNSQPNNQDKNAASSNADCVVIRETHNFEMSDVDCDASVYSAICEKI